MIQLTRTALLSTDDLDAQREEFARCHILRLPKLVHPELLAHLQEQLATCEWTLHCDGQIATELVPKDPRLVNTLNFIVNAAEFIKLVANITARPLQTFGGRVYKMAPDSNHFDSWHSDCEKYEDRLVGMSINLGPTLFEGGVFLLRDESSQVVLAEVENTGPGDAILFRIGRDLKHMVSAIKGTEAKIAFAGWFRSADYNFYNDLRSRATRT